MKRQELKIKINSIRRQNPLKASIYIKQQRELLFKYILPFGKDLVSALLIAEKKGVVLDEIQKILFEQRHKFKFNTDTSISKLKFISQ